MLLTYSRLIREMPLDHLSGEESLALRALVSLTVSKIASFSSSLCVWRNVRTCVAQTFGRQTLSMVWDFGEMNPFAESAGDLGEGITYLVQFIEHINASVLTSGCSQWADAEHSPLPDDLADVVATDPPYYDAIPYNHLSEFFQIWLAAAGVLATTERENVQNRLNECIVDEGLGKNRDFYEKKMAACLSEGRRVAKPSAIGMIVFAHKSTSGWESQLKAMIDAGWVITSSWPIDTERSGRLRAFESAALASSVHLVCRPREYSDGSLRMGDVGEWRDVLRELPSRIHEWLPRLAREGIVGADAIFACLGPALEIFSRYSQVERADGALVPLLEYLEEVWAAVAKEALSLLFREADASGLEPDARLTAMWLWTLRTDTSGTNGNGSPEEEADEDQDAEDEDPQDRPFTGGVYAIESDAARKIAQGLGANLDILKSLVEVKGKTARLLLVSEREPFLFARQRSPQSVSRLSQPTNTHQTTRRGKSKRPAKGQQAFGVNEEEGLSSQPATQREARADVSPYDVESSNWTTAETVLDRVHQSMLLFAKGQADALKRFLVDDGIGKEARFWKLAQALSALYPRGSDEKRWVDGVLARKKGLGL